jgi:hypothetical protein
MTRLDIRPPTLALPLKGGGKTTRYIIPSPLEGEGRVGGVEVVVARSA